MSAAAPLPTGSRRDALFGGRLALLQPEAGPRTTIDSVLLAAFAAQVLSGRRVLDLGAGVGALALCAWHLGLGQQLELVEWDPELAALAELNAAAASAPARVHVAEVASLPPALVSGVDVVLCNPPYFAPGTTRPPSGPRALRAEVGELGPFLRATSQALGPRGRAAFAYPTQSLAELLRQAAELGLMPKRLRFVHPTADAPARLALVELKPARPGGLAVESPLVEWQATGVRSAEIAALIASPAVDRR